MPHVHTCPCGREHACYGIGCTPEDEICDECAEETEACTCGRGAGKHHPDCPSWDPHGDNYD